MTLEWGTCGGAWCHLAYLDASSLHGVGGVYIIWHGNEVLWTGQANDLKRRFNEHRTREDDLVKFVVDAYPDEVCVTWAHLSEIYRDGVEKFLFDRCAPSLTRRAPNEIPTPVNLPW